MTSLWDKIIQRCATRNSGSVTVQYYQYYQYNYSDDNSLDSSSENLSAGGGGGGGGNQLKINGWNANDCVVRK